jgi:hypothetical protein
MDGKLWRRLYRIVMRLGDSGRGPRQQYADWEILAWYLWAALNDRPAAWLAQSTSLPAGLKSRRRPSAATLSRRLRSSAITALLGRLERLLTTPRQGRLCKYIDGKPLPVGHASKDSAARFGRRTKGYRIHVIVDENHAIYARSVRSNDVSEVRVAEELIPQLAPGGYLVGDGEYDASTLHDLAHARGHQLIAPRARPGTGFGHCRQSPARKRCCALLEKDPWIDNGFGAALVNARRQVERFFGNLTSFAGGLGPLPPWVRTLPRVERWVQAKLAINAVRIELKNNDLGR